MSGDEVVGPSGLDRSPNRSVGEGQQLIRSLRQSERPRVEPRSLLDYTEKDWEPIYRRCFPCGSVREAFLKLPVGPKEIVLAMWRYSLGLVMFDDEKGVKPLEVSQGEGPGPYWVWRRFEEWGGAEMVTIHPLNEDPPYVLDFLVPGSPRSRMSAFELRLPGPIRFEDLLKD